MHPGMFAAAKPDHPAVIVDGGRTLSYRELNSRSLKFAHTFKRLGVGEGDNVALLLPNGTEFLEAAWGAHRIGVYYTPINYHLTPGEAAYILNDCQAKVLVTACEVGDPACYFAQAPGLSHIIAVDGEASGCLRGSDVLSAPDMPLDADLDGAVMLYSSGTTGRPKGIKAPLPRRPIGEDFSIRRIFEVLSVDGDSRFITPAPLYHAAPLAFSMGLHRIGATLVLMRKFDAERCLDLMRERRVTNGQFVPTMFTRFLQLPPEIRSRFSAADLKSVVHSAAPCPPEVKRAMIAWWGPIVWEYYASSENHGVTMLDAEEWLCHPGSVGRPVRGVAHIVRDDGSDAATGEIGEIYFSGGAPFAYHGDAEKTASAHNGAGWATVGDRGYLDADGYLYLADRSNDMIISGGVNIYPREAEDALALHPFVSDVAVIGVPNKEFGEEVKALVVPRDWSQATPAAAQELIGHCRSKIAHFKCPQSVDFVTELPRLPNGKLYRRRAREVYWRGHGSAIV
ncbi:MAG TPA: AMP-binding protein [Rhizomicrobium sp.]